MSLQLRFRHTSSDLGPISFAETSSVQQVKEQLLSSWPADGPLSKDVPSSAACLMLIFNGKVLDNGKQLRDYKREMGDITPDTIVTMLLAVRAAPTAAKASPAVSEEAPKGCACAVQ